MNLLLGTKQRLWGYQVKNLLQAMFIFQFPQRAFEIYYKWKNYLLIQTIDLFIIFLNKLMSH
jgi:hypothetical protein